ncbi:MAG: response regulator [Myxococcales bacterium]|nr:response regulator [Myxococcales bacterium]
MSSEAAEPRIIVIDDNEAIQADFKTILDARLILESKKSITDDALNDLEEELFGAADKHGDASEDDFAGFEIETASQGQEGYEKVKAAIEAGTPFSLAFVDMRMPPGWDGLITAEHLLQADPGLEIVICSAYSDYSWSEIDKRLGFTDQFMMIKKPFDTDAVRQMATNLTRRWGVRRQARVKEGELEKQVLNRTREIESIRLAAEKADSAKAEFLANVNHEVRTPMTVILGYAELLLSNDGMNLEVAERIEGLEMIRRNSEKLLELIHEFVDLTKIEGGRLFLDAVSFSPKSLAAEMHSLMKVHSEEKELPLRFDIADDLPDTIISDPHRIRQILSILVGNAIRFTSKGEVAVRVEPFDDESGRPCIAFEISDTGIGISPSHIQRLFEPFSNETAATLGRFGGTGLGVSLSRKLAQLLGGDVTVESQLDRGTRFRVWLPTRLPARDAFESTSQTKAMATGPIPTIDCRMLLVEDTRNIQVLIAMVLRKSGATVDLANDGAQAIEKVHNAAAIDEPYDVILMDMKMPVMDGFEAARRLRAEGYKGPIFAVTAWAGGEDEQRCLEAGCDAYFTKPLDRHRLIHAISACITSDPEKPSDE